MDAEDLKLSPERMLVDISVRNGVIDGMISTPQICDSTPFDFLLVRGKVDPIRKSARVIVWDIFGGRKADVAALDLAKDGSVMTVVPREGVVRLFPPQARIAVDPNKSPSEAPFCEGKEEALVSMLGVLRSQRATALQAKQPATEK